MLTTALPPSALADKPWFSFLHRWVAVLLLGFIASVASLNVYATTVGTTVTAKSPPDTNLWINKLVGAGAEYDDGGLAVDIDPAASTITITWIDPIAANRTWTPPKMEFAFSGGTLDQITGVMRTGGTAPDKDSYVPSASGQTITINTPSGTMALGTIIFTFTSTALGATPTLASASPSSGSTAGGTTVTLTGTNLTGATVVSFGGTEATNVTVNSATQITATTPAHAAGAVNVAVTVSGDTATLTNGYTYVVPAPTAGAVSATVAANSSANPITLNLSGGAATSVAVSSAASHGTASASGTSVTYTPTAGYSGADSFTYTASNAGGTSAPATVTLTVSAPTISVLPASLSNGTVGTAYSATVSASGGAAPYSYAITVGSLPTGLSLNTSSGNISGTPTVANTFNFTVTATDVNSATGSQAYNFGVAATAPSAPTIGTATAGNAQASVAFTAPASNGGSAIIGYTATAISGGQTGSCMASPCTVTGLTNGTSYTFIVTATNSAGTGAASAASNAITPAAVPVTGVCGSAHGVAVLTAPSVNLCSPGTASSVTSAAAAFAWDCAGSNGGTTAQCSAPRQYQVTASAVANGSIAPAGVQTVAYNAVPNFTVTPVALYRIDSVSGCGGTLVGSTYTTGAVAANCTVSASFALIAHAITATAQPSAGGTVSCTPSSVGEGSSAACTAVANAGYVFQKWTGACAGQAAACSLTNVTAPQTSAALFQQEKTGLTVPQGSQQGQGLGLVLEPSANNWVIQNASTATVASTGTSAPSGVDLPHGLVNLTLVTGTPGTSASVVLTYPQPLPAGTKYYKFGKTAANTTNHWYEFSGAVISGSTITLTIVDGGEGDNDLTANSTIDDPGGPAVVTAPPPPPPPAPLVTVNLQVSINGAGTVERSVTGNLVAIQGSTTTVQYPEYQTLTLTAQPAVGARFTGWSGACAGLLPCQLTLRSNQTVQATFSNAPPAITCRARAFSASEERLLDAYLAYYGRPADVAGLAYWRAQADQRGDLDFTIDAFSNATEFKRRFGQMDATQLIANLYQQMYGRAPDTAGAAYYGAHLASGQSSLVSIAIHIFDGRLGRDRLVVENRRKVARHFVTRFEELGSAAPTINDAYVMAGLFADVGTDAASAEVGCAQADRLLESKTGP